MFDKYIDTKYGVLCNFGSKTVGKEYTGFFTLNGVVVYDLLLPSGRESTNMDVMVVLDKQIRIN